MVDVSNIDLHENVFIGKLNIKDKCSNKQIRIFFVILQFPQQDYFGQISMVIYNGGKHGKLLTNIVSVAG